MIRFIIDTTVQKQDGDGNCYNFSAIISTKTGKIMRINSGWGSSGSTVQGLLANAGIDYSEIYYSERVVSVRKYDELEKYVVDFVNEHDVTGRMVLALEKKG